MRLSRTYKEILPRGYQALLGLQREVNEATLPRRLRELVAFRASQINGCTFCLGHHLREAEASGLSTRDLALLAGWNEAPVFDAREKAALAWTELLTRLSDRNGADGALDAAFAALGAHFDEQEITELTLAIVAINAWNRVNVAFAVPPPAP